MSIPFLSKCFFNRGKNFFRTFSWCVCSRNSFGNPIINIPRITWKHLINKSYQDWPRFPPRAYVLYLTYLPCIAYLLSTISCDSAQKASSSSIKYIKRSAAICDIPKNNKTWLQVWFELLDLKITLISTHPNIILNYLDSSRPRYCILSRQLKHETGLVVYHCTFP